MSLTGSGLDDTLRVVAKSFAFEREVRDGFELVRWLGDAEFEGWARHDLWEDGTPRFVGQYAMFGIAGLLYPALLGIVWRLTNGQARLVLPSFDGVLNCERVGHPYVLVDWEYGIDWEASDWSRRDRGFVAAESLRHVPGSQDSERFSAAALARVGSWAELMALLPVGDQANTTSVFGIADGDESYERLLAILHAENKPSLGDLVEDHHGMFAVITQEDEGLGLSSLLMAGAPGFHSRFEREARQLQARLDAYLQATTEARDQAAWFAAINSFADVGR